MMYASIDQIYDAFTRCGAVSTDTRKVNASTLFVALKGERFDANQMVQQALDAGAPFVVTSNADFAGRQGVLLVRDTLSALQLLAAEHRRHLSIPVLGITGTNGKTTTKELVSAVLRKKFKVAATVGNLNNQIGVPLTVLSIPSDAEIAVVEMGASHPGDILELVRIAQPTAGLITNVGRAHILGFGSFDGVRRTKGELYDHLKWNAQSPTVFVDASNPFLVEMLQNRDVETWGSLVPYAAEGNVQDFDSWGGVRGSVVGHGEMLRVRWASSGSASHEVSTNLTGEYNLPNVLAAIAVGAHFGVDADAICEALADYTPTNSRSQIVQTSRNRLVVDAYNANPSSMEAALVNLSNSSADHKAVILGAMRELGADEEAEHRAVLDRLSSMNLDFALLVGPEFMRFKADYPRFQFFENTPDVEGALGDISGKYILVKGSNSNKLSSLVDKL